MVTAAVDVQSCPLFHSCAGSALPQAPLQPLVAGECGFSLLRVKESVDVKEDIEWIT